MLKRLTALFLSLICSFVITTNTINATDESYEEDQSVYLCFDSRESFQQLSYFDDNGNLITISVSSGSLYGEKTITMSSTNLTLSFNIYISGNNITSAYNGTYSSNYWNVTPVSLIVDSPKQATYTVTCKRLITSVSKYLRATLNNGDIVVSTNY